MMQNPCIFKGSLILEGVFSLFGKNCYPSIFESENYKIQICPSLIADIDFFYNYNFTIIYLFRNSPKHNSPILAVLAPIPLPQKTSPFSRIRAAVGCL